MNNSNEKLLISEFTNSIVEQLKKRIANIDKMMEVVPMETQINLNNQRIALNESIKIVQDEFMKKINDLN